MELVRQFLNGGTFTYEYDPEPSNHPSFNTVTGLIYRMGEYCELTRGLVPGFSLKMSHLKVSGYCQHVFRTQALELTPDGKLKLKASLSGRIRNRVCQEFHSDIFDLA